MSKDKSIILVVEDDPDVAEMLNAYFNVQGYEVVSAYQGEDGVRLCSEKRPNLVVLDIRLPDIDGYEVARRLRSARRTREIPIIFLTEKRSRQDRLQGLELGADDYITKPFDVQELRLRVRNALRRSLQGTLTNPVTGMPEGSLLTERLAECLENKDWGILVISLENLGAFREAYGFVASDDVLRAISLMIHNAVRDLGSPSDFIAQLSQAKFLLITQPDRMQDLGSRIHTRLEQSLDYFYPLKDRGKTSLAVKHLSVKIQQVQASNCRFTTVDELKGFLDQVE